MLQRPNGRHSFCLGPKKEPFRDLVRFGSEMLMKYEIAHSDPGPGIGRFLNWEGDFGMDFHSTRLTFGQS